jgi:hypothetical protein
VLGVESVIGRLEYNGTLTAATTVLLRSAGALAPPDAPAHDAPMGSESAAAILVTGVEATSALLSLGRALAARRYVLHEASVPAGYPLALDERIALRVGEHASLVVIHTPVDAVFRLARWWSMAEPDQELAAVRRYLHMAPVLKYFGQGLPIWKIGDDPDHEVDFEVPTRRPIDAFEPESAGLPTSASAAAQALDNPVTDLIQAWIRASSKLVELL